MTNLEKMNELVGRDSDISEPATKEQIMNWAYANRIHVMSLHLDEKEFESMENSVQDFVDSDSFGIDEFENWDKFLDRNYVN